MPPPGDLSARMWEQGEVQGIVLRGAPLARLQPSTFAEYAGAPRRVRLPSLPNSWTRVYSKH
eukprot:11379446-Prorocentrum_lima.AAC.1